MESNVKHESRPETHASNHDGREAASTLVASKQRLKVIRLPSALIVLESPSENSPVTKKKERYLYATRDRRIYQTIAWLVVRLLKNGTRERFTDSPSRWWKVERLTAARRDLKEADPKRDRVGTIAILRPTIESVTSSVSGSVNDGAKNFSAFRF